MTDNPRPNEPAEPLEAGSARPEPAEEPPEPQSPGELLERAQEDAQKYLANWQRAEADFQNYKRRVDQERDDNRRFASAALIINILPIVDDLERALMSVDIRIAGLTWLDGIRLIHRKLQLVLEHAGVSVIPTEGQQFDPNVHEAVMHSEGEEGKVLAEVQRGYKLHDRVLRPAMVVVGQASGEKTEGSGQSEEEGSGTGEGEPS